MNNILNRAQLRELYQRIMTQHTIGWFYYFSDLSLKPYRHYQYLINTHSNLWRSTPGRISGLYALGAYESAKEMRYTMRYMLGSNAEFELEKLLGPLQPKYRYKIAQSCTPYFLEIAGDDSRLVILRGCEIKEFSLYAGKN